MKPYIGLKSRIPSRVCMCVWCVFDGWVTCWKQLNFRWKLPWLLLNFHHKFSGSGRALVLPPPPFPISSTRLCISTVSLLDMITGIWSGYQTSLATSETWPGFNKQGSGLSFTCQGTLHRQLYQVSATYMYYRQTCSKDHLYIKTTCL